MKKNIDTKILTEKYRVYLIPIFLFLLSGCMVLFVIWPQFSSLSTNSSSIQEQRDAINVLKNSQRALDEMKSSIGTSGVDTANIALPSEKDVILIYSTVSALAAKYNVALRTFNVKVGNFYSKDTTVQQSNPIGIPNLKVVLGIQFANFNDMVNYSKSLYQALPVAEVNSLQANNQDGSLDVLFYYKPFNAAVLAKATSIAPLTQAEKQLLGNLSDWERNSK